MIQEDYVSFGTAKLLKKKGFDGECDLFGRTDEPELIIREAAKIAYNQGIDDECVVIPTHQMAIKWLREVHHWHIFVIPRWEDVEYMPGEWEEEMVGYQYVILSVGEVNRKNEQPQPAITALTSESAYEAGIRYCLENLI